MDESKEILKVSLRKNLSSYSVVFFCLIIFIIVQILK